MTASYKLADDAASVKGIGAKKRERLEQLGITTVEDLLNHLPVRYRNRSAVTVSSAFTDGFEYLAVGTLRSKRLKRLSYKRTVLELTVRDEGGLFYVSFFNTPYLAGKLEIGERYSFFGRVQFRNGIRLFTNPDINAEGDAADLRGFVPVYRCTKGVTTKDFIKWMREALLHADLDDWLSEELKEKRRLCDLSSAYENIHFPKGNSWYKVASYRLTYDSLLIYQLALKKNSLMLEAEDIDASVPCVDMQPFYESLPFEYTEGQAAAVKDILRDLAAAKPMNRLIQGDVGCGKTAVAEAAIYNVIKAGGQAAFMAPTEILARQHYDKLSRSLAAFGIRTELLVSGIRASERKKLLSELADGSVDLLIGTHALIQEDVAFRKLSLVITDEQHRFGVNQRKTLIGKGAANVLVMSATPIPRTLAATVFGDMDFSVIRSMPANRKEIVTRKYGRGSRELAYKLVADELAKGNQAYVVAPSIENDDESDLASAEALYGEMKKRFRSHSVGLIHGRLDKAEKESIMNDFLEHRIDLLVSTVVIEVGIDVPAATVILIENAERFGLAQLHQLRGRVGRSDRQSYCCLICCSDSDAAVERMNIMVEMSSGFDISEADYRLRGAGDLMGTMQHGLSGGRLYSLFSHVDILELAGEDASGILSGQERVNEEEMNRRIKAAFSSDNSSVL